MADAGWTLQRGGLRIERLPPAPIAVVRVRGGDPAATVRVGSALGAEMPAEPNSAVDCTAGRICWLAPGEWMIVGGMIDTGALAEAIAPATGHVADVGEGRVRYRLAGERARYVLAKGTSLDLDRALSPSRCAQTLFAQTLALIDLRGNSGDIELTADITYARHLEGWFDEAARELSPGDA